MREMILDALVKNAEGCIAIHKANIEVYLNSSTGIGEHSDILEAIQNELDKIAAQQDRLDVLYTHFKEV
tara:strand:- start:2982 stop:3188 length:207 start_codon:yes stop_codon:yes gene_type:complete